jgi:hypothetical protein
MGSTAIGDSDEPVYWSGSAFVKAGAYPTKASWNYDDVYLKLTGGNLTGKLTIKTDYFGNQLALDRGADGGSWGPSITFYNNGTFLACLGVDTNGTLYRGDNGSTKYAIYHTGNLTTSAAASGGTTASLVTTGDKYKWNLVYDWLTTTTADTDTTINKWKELEAFLSSVTESDTLTGLLA